MKKIISTVAALAVMGIVANAMATTTTTTTTTATKPAAATTTGATTTAPAAAKPAQAPATTAAVKPATTTTTAVAPAAKPATTTVSATNVTGQVIALDPTTIKVKDLKSNQEWALNVGTANVKTYKVGDKVMCTYDGATKTLKTIEMAK